MNTDERHRLIGGLLRDREHVTVDELIAACGASGATVRRDLDILALHGVLRTGPRRSQEPGFRR